MNLSDLLFSKKCLGCSKTGWYICPECVQKSGRINQDCPYCEKPSIDGNTHFKCAKKYGLDGLISLFRYAGVIRKAILNMKYGYVHNISKELGGYVSAELKDRGILNVLPYTFHLFPIPMYWYKRNLRGFNQSEEIGKTIAGEMGWTYSDNVLERVRSTLPQATLTPEQRRKNLKNAFGLNSKVMVSQYSNVILFDDVFTSGTTLFEACGLLKKAGVRRVWGLTMAR